MICYKLSKRKKERNDFQCDQKCYLILKISENIFKIHQNKKKSKKANKYFHRSRKFFSGKIGLVVFL